MSPDWSMGEPDAAAPLVPDVFDPSGLGLVLSGRRGEVTWEVYDGPHPLAAQPQALGSQFTAGIGQAGRTAFGGVGDVVRSDQAALIESSAVTTPETCWGFLQARCHPLVRSAVLHTSTGATEAAEVITSPHTGEGWVVWFLDHDDPAPTRIELLDGDGAVLASQPVLDPRTRATSVSRRGRR